MSRTEKFIVALLLVNLMITSYAYQRVETNSQDLIYTVDDLRYQVDNLNNASGEAFPLP